MSANNVFLLSWDINGLESCVNISLLEQENILNILKDKPSSSSPANRLANSIVLRATFNPQRFYEVYTVEATEEITEKDLVNLFEQDPQGSADLIRKRGYCIYSNRLDLSKAKIF